MYWVSDDPAKAARSDALIMEGGVVSVQVLNEFTNVSRKKYKNPWPKVLSVLVLVRDCCTVVPVTLDIHERGLQLAQAHQFQPYDAMIVAAAQLSGCTVLYSEDMHDGLSIGGLTIRNPYR